MLNVQFFTILTIENILGADPAGKIAPVADRDEIRSRLGRPKAMKVGFRISGVRDGATRMPHYVH